MSSLLKLLVLGIVLAIGWKAWNGHKANAATVVNIETGFVQAYAVDGSSPNTVLILTPENCPSEAAQRAVALARDLDRMGIPYTTGSGFSISADNPSPEQQAGFQQAVNVFQKGPPAVFINGWASSNPSAAQVAAEFKRTKSKG